MVLAAYGLDKIRKRKIGRILWPLLCEIAKLAKDLRKKSREARLKKNYLEFAKEFKEFPIWDCQEFEDCSRLDFLRPTHGNAHIKNLNRIKDHDLKAFLSGRRYW